MTNKNNECKFCGTVVLGNLSEIGSCVSCLHSETMVKNDGEFYYNETTKKEERD